MYNNCTCFKQYNERVILRGGVVARVLRGGGFGRERKKKRVRGVVITGGVVITYKEGSLYGGGPSSKKAM